MSGAFFVFIAFIVLANLLRLAGKTGGAGKGPGLPPRPGPHRYRPGDPRRLPGGRGLAESSAATMVPEELWRILMGEAPPAPAPRPAPRSAPARLDDEVAEDLEAEIAEGRPADEAVSLEDLGGGAAPAGAAATRPAPGVRTAEAPAEAPRAPAPRSRARELRRAIVLREVLGPPRGLE